MTHRVGNALIEAFGDRIASDIGMCFEQDRRHDLLRAIDALALPAADLHALVSRPWTQADIEFIAPHLCVGETYFFRDRAAFDLLEFELLPPLIAERRATTRQLRLWSAGCSTGEEAYSLAITVSRLVPDHADWDIEIVGTDIHPGFLERAESGVYGDWSFRGVPDSVRENCFDALADGRVAVKPAQKGLTRFCYGNLTQPVSHGAQIDLILCRNVLMYFGREQAIETVRHMHASLSAGGLLLVAPTEAGSTHEGLYEGFGELRFEQGLIYRKQSVVERGVAQAAGSASRASHRPLAVAPARDPGPAMDDRRLARALADCEAALLRDKCEPQLHLRHAQLLEAAMRPDEARDALRRALFLDPALASARAALERLALPSAPRAGGRAPTHSPKQGLAA